MSVPTASTTTAVTGAIARPMGYVGSTASTNRSEKSARLRKVILGRLSDYVQLTKPKIAVLALLTVCLGFALATAGHSPELDWWKQLSHGVIGIGLVACASSAWNQWIERRVDGLMIRTRKRPLPSGRVTSREAFAFSLISTLVGVIWLVVFVNYLTATLALLTLILYVAIYTPLKRYTVMNTVVGAIPGALPPVLGWTAGGGELDISAFVLFAILFLWQFPHFMAIAWLYRQDYADGGFRMVPVTDPSGIKTGLIAVGYAVVLLPISWLPSEIGMAGHGYQGAATILGLWYILAATIFLVKKSVPAARWLLWTSLVYLPALLGVLVWDRYQLLS